MRDFWKVLVIFLACSIAYWLGATFGPITWILSAIGGFYIGYHLDDIVDWIMS